jgi:hypothetical protein
MGYGPLGPLEGNGITGSYWRRDGTGGGTTSADDVGVAVGGAWDWTAVLRLGR